LNVESKRTLYMYTYYLLNVESKRTLYMYTYYEFRCLRRLIKVI